jgi:hypothetical protein
VSKNFTSIDMSVSYIPLLQMHAAVAMKFRKHVTGIYLLVQYVTMRNLSNTDID